MRLQASQEMREKLLTNMFVKKKGSITVFLSLVLVLLFSFVLTALEGARIKGATAYLSMLSELAGDSLLGHYYAPLFEEYRVFGFFAGDGKGYFDVGAMEELLEETINFGVKGMSGGLLTWESAEVEVDDYDTMLSETGTGLMEQMKSQVLLDGGVLALSQLFSKEMFSEAAVAGQIYQKQEEALEEVTPVLKDILKLMELTDGICTGDGGLELGENGRLQVQDAFIKQIVPMEEKVFLERFDNPEVAAAVQAKIYPVDEVALRVYSLAEQGIRLKEQLSMLEYALECGRNSWAEMQWEWQELQEKEETGENQEGAEETRTESKIETQQDSIGISDSPVDNETVAKEGIANQETAKNDIAENDKVQNERKERIALLEQQMQEIQRMIRQKEKEIADISSEKNRVLKDASKQYNELKQTMKAVQEVLKETQKVLDGLEKKQLAARVAVDGYELFLKGIKNSLSEELYQVFENELDTMKAYLGIEGQGYVVSQMKQTVVADSKLLEELELTTFSEWNLSKVQKEMESLRSGISRYTVDGLWFSYGKITVTETTGQNVLGLLKEFLTEGMLALVGVTEEKVSERKLDGLDLPSAGLSTENLAEELMDCIEEMMQLFQSADIAQLFSELADKALDSTALELYCMKYFYRYGEEAPYTKLNYEREYLLFGGQEDKVNLMQIVLRLVAVRTLFSMVAILKNPEKMAELGSFSAGVAGLTGIPILLAVTKYALLLLWSVEEAFVEVAALLQSKRVAVLSSGGCISFSEVFRFGRAMITTKAKNLAESAIGAGYQEYLLLFSLFVPMKEKLYRAMDLMQENIRYRYDDSFRMRNVVTGIKFCARTRLKGMFYSGVFPQSVYEIKCEERSCYE